jgi:hypothetical protein
MVLNSILVDSTQTWLCLISPLTVLIPLVSLGSTSCQQKSAQNWRVKNHNMDLKQTFH